MDGDSLLPVLLLALLSLLGAYFACSETAFSSSSKVRLRARAEDGDKRAKKSLYVVNNFDKAISTILIGNNIAHIGFASTVTFLVTTLWGEGAVTYGTIASTVFVFLFTELIPKNFGKAKSEPFALWAAGSLSFLMKALTPVSAVFTALSNLASKLVAGKEEPTVTEDELYDILDEMKQKGSMAPVKTRLIHSALEFDDITAENVFTSRVDVVAVDADLSCPEIVELIKSCGHSRLPVYRDDMDNIIGILQIRKYLKAYLRQGEKVDLIPLLDKPYFVPKSREVDKVLEEMSANKVNMAVVTDDYGGTLGIITVEDILEELVGEIWDEDDEVTDEFASIGGGRYDVSVDLGVGNAFEMMNYDDYDSDEIGHVTIGTWAMENFGHIPRQGERFNYRSLTVEALKVTRQRVTKLRITVAPKEQTEEKIN